MGKTGQGRRYRIAPAPQIPWRSSTVDLGAKGTASPASGPRGPVLGVPGDLWTQPQVAEVIRREFGVSYDPSQVGRILKQCGLSLQKPLRRATQRDETAIQRWKEERWPMLKKRR